MTTTKPRIIGTALAAWADTFRAIAAMPIVFSIALAINLALSVVTAAVVRDPVAFAASDRLYDALLVVASAVLTGVLFAPLAIVVHRFVLLGETTDRYPLDPFSARYVRFVDFAILLKLALVLPNTLSSLEATLSLDSITTAVLSLATAVLTVVLIIVAVRRVILFPAIVIDAPGATWSNARHDTKGISWRVFFIFVCTALPQLVVSTLITVVVLGAGSGGLLLSLIGPFVGIPTIGAFAAAASCIFRARADSLIGASS